MPGRINWNPELMEVGHLQIDAQHRQLIALFDKFIQSFRTPKDIRSSSIRNAFAAITIYTDIHFNAEENLMTKHNYPFIKEHVEGHEKIKKEISAIVELFNNDTSYNPEVLIGKVREWANMIPMSKDDKELAHYLNRVGKLSA